jgi:RimJ/RimL family protein N-acetyltransferase
MIRGTHAVIRTAEADDAAAFRRLYESEDPRSALLNRHREIVTPSNDELVELLDQSAQRMTPFYVIEDPEGSVCGFCALRSAVQLREATFYAEMICLFFDDNYETPMADEVFAWITRMGFEDMSLQKIIAHCLGCETALRAWLTGKGFESSGVQRDVLFTQGRWHNIETCTLHAPPRAAEPQDT